MQLFGSLKLLMALLGSSCPLFGRSGPKMGPKMVPKRGPKSDQKMVHKIIPNGPKNGKVFARFWSKSSPLCSTEYHGVLSFDDEYLVIMSQGKLAILTAII